MTVPGHFLPPLPDHESGRGRVYNVTFENGQTIDGNNKSKNEQESEMTSQHENVNQDGNFYDESQQITPLIQTLPFPKKAMKEFNIMDTSHLMKNDEWPIVLDDALAIESNKLSKLPPNDEEIRRKVETEGMITVRVITWNQQAKDPSSNELLEEKMIPLQYHHVIAINTQECENSFTKSLLNPSKVKWEMTLSEILGKNYEMIRSHSLQASHSAVFVHRAIIHLVSKVDSCAIPTGICDTLGNKGGIGISVKLGSSSFCFLNAHLAAHQSELDRRAYEFKKISTDIAGKLGDMGIELEGTVSNAEDEESVERKKHSICCCPRGDKTVERNPLADAFDYVFWGGDFNFRLNGTRDIIETLINDNEHKVLLHNEQFKLLMDFDPFFKDLIEGPLNFRPTYRYDEGVDIYDTSTKRRVPSWTDRVLFKNDNGVRLISYASVQDIRSSDHRPVYATFRVSINSTDNQSTSQSWKSESKSEVCVIS